MARYTVFEPGVELTGRAALGFITNMMHDDMAPILKKHGFEKVDPDAWYPMQSMLDVLNDIADNLDSVSSFVSIGMAVADQSLEGLPPAVKAMPLADFFVQYEKLYQTRHRGGDSGYMHIEQPDEHHIIIHARNPYPDDLTYGAMYGYARYFLNKADKGFVLKYDDTAPRHDEGGHETVMHILIDQ